MLVQVGGMVAVATIAWLAGRRKNTAETESLVVGGAMDLVRELRSQLDDFRDENRALQKQVRALKAQLTVVSAKLDNALARLAEIGHDTHDHAQP